MRLMVGETDRSERRVLLPRITAWMRADAKSSFSAASSSWLSRAGIAIELDGLVAAPRRLSETESSTLRTRETDVHSRTYDYDS